MQLCIITYVDFMHIDHISFCFIRDLQARHLHLEGTAVHIGALEVFVFQH